jgi:hypothetical protein
MIAASAIYEWSYVTDFRKELHDILKNDRVPEKDQALEALQFLQQQVALSEEELREVGSDEEAKQKKFFAKYDRFVRRVGAEVAKNVVNESTRIVKELKADKPDKALEEAKELVKAADFESFKKLVQDITLLFIAALMIASAVVGLLLSNDISSMITLVNSAFWLTIDWQELNTVISQVAHAIHGKGWEWGDAKAPVVQVEKAAPQVLQKGSWQRQRLRVVA